MVRGVLGHYSSPKERGPVEQQKELIDRVFAFDTVEEILAALLNETNDFALKARQTMLEKSPTSLKVALAAAARRARVKVARRMLDPRIRARRSKCSSAAISRKASAPR